MRRFMALVALLLVAMMVAPWAQQVNVSGAVAAFTGGTIDGTVIGGTTPAAGTFTTLATTSTITMANNVNFQINDSGGTARLAILGTSTNGVLYRPLSSSGAVSLQNFAGTNQFVVSGAANGGVTVGDASLTVVKGEVGMTKITASGSAPGGAGGKFELVCGTNAGTAKLIAYAGTSTTPVTITDNIGSGVTGC